ncbi:unnamed protein product [Arctogadus glacialis]
MMRAQEIFWVMQRVIVEASRGGSPSCSTLTFMRGLVPGPTPDNNDFLPRDRTRKSLTRSKLLRLRG